MCVKGIFNTQLSSFSIQSFQRWIHFIFLFIVNMYGENGKGSFIKHINMVDLDLFRACTVSAETVLQISTELERQSFINFYTSTVL